MTQELPRTIPEARIAINPIVIDDSKRQSKSHRAPIDEYSLLSRLTSWELEEHLSAHKHQGFTKGLEHMAAEKAYRRVIELIQNGRVRQMHRRLIPEDEHV